MERDFVCVRVDASGVVGSGLVEENEVNHSHGGDDEWEQEVECEEPREGSVVYREATSDSLNEGAANVRDCRKKISDDSGTPKRHLAPGENVPNEGSHHD